MKAFHKASLVATLLLSGAAACADLDVANVNNPDRTRAIRTPGDVESLIAGSYAQWWVGNNDYAGASLFLSVASFQHSSTAANAGMLRYGAIPRVPITNDRTHPDYANFAYPWYQSYKALAATADAMRAIKTDTLVSKGLGASATTRARAFGRFIQGISHASVAALYDKGYIVDETVPVLDPEQPGGYARLTPVGYQQLMTKALTYLDSAIAISKSANFTLPAGWMSREVSSAELVRIAHSLKARYRANVARTPAERQAVDWNAVLADVMAGVDEDFNVDLIYIDTNWTVNAYIWYAQDQGWQQANYFVHGMADQSGNYQRWLAKPVSQRDAVLDGAPVLIVTPDERFPQGTTLAQQTDNPGKYFWITPSTGASWTQPARGTWRWSYYWQTYGYELVYEGSTTEWGEIRVAEMDFLAAEAYFRTNRVDMAVDIINDYRTANGLNETNAAGLNTSCVPKLPSGACGNLFEMLKWEKRLETWGVGLMSAPWYFDGRGWGDLYRGTPLQLPIPAVDLQVVTGETAPYTFGGVGGPSASPGSSYAWPGE